MSKQYILYYLLICLLLLNGLSLYSQKKAKIKIVNANELKPARDRGEDVKKLLGNVIMKHDSTYLFCDSAFLDENTNRFDGYSNVRIKVSDTLNIYSDVLHYDGNIRLAELLSNVKLMNKSSTLTTNHLYFNRNTEIAYYLTGGKIVDSANILTSRKAYFYTAQDFAFFKEDVVLLNEDYVMKSDTMKYDTETEISYFFGPTTIDSDDNIIYCEHGWYDTRNDQSVLEDHAYIMTEEQLIEGDSMYYDRNLDFGQAFYHVSLTDTIEGMLARGQYGEFNNKAYRAFVTDSAYAVVIEQEDSLFVHGDTLRMYYNEDNEVERMKVYNSCKFYREDVQGMCDSLLYDFSDSSIYMFNKPILWSEENQLTADTIYFALKNNQLDTIVLQDQAMIISVDDSVFSTFNQVKGKQIVGYYREGEMKKVKVNGNSEFVYYLREDADNSLIGVNTAISSDMLIFLEENKIQTLSILNKPTAQLYPYDQIAEDKKKLNGFSWHVEFRPLKMQDIFIRENTYPDEK